MSKILSFAPYALVVVTLGYGLIDIVKDWENYKRSGLKIGAIVGLVLIAAFTLISLGQDAKQREKQSGDLRSLQGEVSATNDAQKENTKLYVASFKDLSEQLTDVKTQVKTEALQNKITSLQSQLVDTQKALLVPKTHLDFSFTPHRQSDGGSTIVPTTDTILPVGTDNVIHVPFEIINLTDIDADDGEFIFIVCNACKYAKEPDQSTKPSTAPEVQRNFVFNRILAKSNIGESADVIVPARVDAITLGYTYRCKTCIPPPEAIRVTVRLQRTFERQTFTK